MSLLHAIAHRLRVLALGERYARDQAREIRFHLELDAMAADGRTADPELIALQRFGNVTYYREEARAMSPLHWLDRIRHDAAYTLRTLRLTPGFTVTVVLTLALGFGVNAAMFSMLDALFLRMPDGVVAPRDLRRLYVQEHRPDEPGGTYTFEGFPYPQFRAIVAANPGAAIAGTRNIDSVGIRIGNTTVPASRSEVTANYFSVLGVHPHLGRFFAADEGRVEDPSYVAVIGDRLWHAVFNANPAVVGQRIFIDRRPFTIIGVAPPDFRGIDLQAVDLWVPFASHVGHFSGSNAPWYETFNSDIRTVFRASDPSAERAFIGRTENAFRSVQIPYYSYDPKSNLLPGSIIAALGPTKLSNEIIVAQRVSATALAVLLIACANVVNLLLLRASKRKREIAVRRALGSSQQRLIEQVVVESVTLSLGSGLIGVLFAYWAGIALRRLLMPRMHWSTPVVDAHSAGFILGLSLVVGLLSGLAPALQGLRPSLIDALRAGSRDVAYRPSRLRAALLVVQTALCVVLLVGAGLFLRSLHNVQSIGVGYDVDRVAMIEPVFPDGPFAHPADMQRVMPAIAAQLARVPGVELASFASSGPMWGEGFVSVFLPGRDSVPSFGDQHTPPFNAVDTAFFRASGIRVLQGRSFAASDGPKAPGVIIVNETMARVYWPGESAIGKCLILDERSNPCATVIGVVADVHVHDIIEKPMMMYFRPMAQTKAVPLAIVVRLQENAMGAVRLAAERAFRAQLPYADGVHAEMLSALIAPQLRPWRLGASLFIAFGVLALVVAAIGVYSVVAYGVSQRTSEMGIRIALGAQTHDILGLVLGEGVRVVGIGIVLGVGVALEAGKVVSSLLYGIGADDPVVLVLAAVGLATMGLLACLVPALRAAWTDPATALRAE